MKVQLKDITSIRSGFYTKNTVPNGDVHYVQARHFDHDLHFDFNAIPELKLDSKIQKHLLQKEDILIAAKGNKNFAVIYKGETPYAVPSSIFIVITVNDKNILIPDFLAFFLNLPSTQEYFKNNAIGTAIPSISIKLLEQLEIPIPKINQQSKILQIHALRLKEKKIITQLEILKEKVYQHQILKAIK